MTSPGVDAAYRYDRVVEAKGNDSLSEIGRLITPGSTVLDLGASTGALGRFLRDDKKCIVDGVELDPAAAAAARPYYRSLLELDLEIVNLGQYFTAEGYDAIVCADVLEHIKDPGSVLTQLQPLLAEGGRLLISIPNVGYAGVVAGLIQGQFRYRATGLLDSTHLRFFTRASLLELLDKHGFHARAIRPLFVDPRDSEFRDAVLDTLAPAALRALLAQPDALTYQFVVEALPGHGIAPAPTHATPQLHFGVQLYWSVGGGYEESKSSSATAVLGESRQLVELQVPPMVEKISGLRLDVSDRPGYLRIHAIELRDLSNGLLWKWDGLPRSLRPSPGLAVLGDLWIAADDDPSLELPVPASALARLQNGGLISLEMDWPMSADYQFTAQFFEAQSSRSAAERELLLRRLERLEQRLDEGAGAMARMEQAIGRSEEYARSVERAHARQDHAAQQIRTLSARLIDLQRPSFRRQLARELLPSRYLFDGLPLHQLSSTAPGKWQSVGADPHFSLVPRKGRFPVGWVDLRFEMTTSISSILPPTLYLDFGLGYDEISAVVLPPPEHNLIRAEVYLPPGIVAIRFDPVDAAGELMLGLLSMHELGKVRAGLRFAAPILKDLVLDPQRIPHATSAAWRLLKDSGFRGLKKGLIERGRGERGAGNYSSWVTRFDTLTRADHAAIKARIAQLPLRPRFSIIMPVYETPVKWLRRAIDSVREQLYPDWELCIADDASKDPRIRQILERAAARDPRIRFVIRDHNGHISAASNSALALATGDYIALLDHDDQLSPHALYMLAEEIAEHPTADVIYSDEDKIDESGVRYDPYFKPDWNPDLLSSQMYIAHLAAYRANLVRGAGGFREGLEGSQDYDLCLRVVARTSGERIRHVPHVLYHWRSIAGSTAAVTGNKSYAVDAGLRALRDFHGPTATVSEGMFPTTYRVRHPLPGPPALVSLIIPTRDGYRMLSQCISSVLEKTTYTPFEIIVVDNQSTDPRTLEYLAVMERDGRIRVVRYDAPFNYSAINNLAVREARGEVVVLLNNDVEVIEPEWLAELTSQALRPGTGAVGAKLLYPDGTIQHAGVIMGILGIAGHVFRQLPRTAPGYFGRAQLVQNLSGCTAACLAVRRSTYLEVGGLEETHLRVAFNDVDFCLRLCAAGYRNVYTPYAELYHHESVSRGYEDTPEKQERFAREAAFVKHRWGTALHKDPAYNPNLSLMTLQMTLAWPPRASKPWKA
jgi:O-antigen biosynthesis protein